MQISKYLLLSIWFGCLLLLSSAADGDATEIKGPAPALAPGGDNNVFVSEWSELEKDNGGGLGWITTWIIGIGMFCCSFPCLVKNECSAAAIDRTIGAARRAVVKNQPASTTNFHNNGKLVHMQGKLTPGHIKSDDHFGINFDNYLKWRRQVEMYQWIEHRHSESTSDGNGKRKTRVTYTYTKGWSSFPIDSSQFKKPQQEYNPSFPVQSIDASSNPINFGAHYLNPGLTSDVSWFEPFPLTTEHISKVPSERKSQVKLHQGKLYVNSKNPDYPEVGDTRVTYQVVKSQECSVLAQQLGDSFGDWVQGDVDTEYDEEAQQLVSNEGPAVFGHDYILEIWRGKVSADKMLDGRASGNHCRLVAYRVIGYLLMFFGLYWMFSPLTSLLSYIPYVGPLINSSIFILCFFVTLILAFIVIAVAWFFSRPLLVAILGGVLLIAAAATYYFAYEHDPDPVATQAATFTLAYTQLTTAFNA